ncbi:hypothetical protein EYF80_068411 [Liparis tanakae]|uniref:Uncharacterized protein n=1 Tax=Liparis tanakae TaxID=230148 RepID=A0A4Z2DYI3_9TELE|nr:hypothetical protein EYF80_068411 [Liparis tanakae]
MALCSRPRLLPDSHAMTSRLPAAVERGVPLGALIRLLRLLHMDVSIHSRGHDPQLRPHTHSSRMDTITLSGTNELLPTLTSQLTFITCDCCLLFFISLFFTRLFMFTCRCVYELSED